MNTYEVTYRLNKKTYNKVVESSSPAKALQKALTEVPDTKDLERFSVKEI